MYEDALDAGIDPVRFWDYSPGEILDLIYSYERKRAEEEKIAISRMFIHAQVTRRYFFPPEGSSNEAPHPWEYYPELFRKEQQQYEEMADGEQMQQVRNSRKAFAAEHNHRLETQ